MNVIKKVAALLLVMCFINNIQAMRLPKSENFIMAEKAMIGEISATDYLSYIANSFEAYANQIAVIQGRGADYYHEMLEGIEKYLLRMNIQTQKINNVYHNKAVGRVQNDVQRFIYLYYMPIIRGEVEYKKKL